MENVVRSIREIHIGFIGFLQGVLSLLLSSTVFCSDSVIEISSALNDSSSMTAEGLDPSIFLDSTFLSVGSPIRESFSGVSSVISFSVFSGFSGFSVFQV